MAHRGRTDAGHGLKAVHAFALGLRDACTGALNLHRDAPGEFVEDDLRHARALADVAAIGVLHERKVSSAVPSCSTPWIAAS